MTFSLCEAGPTDCQTAKLTEGEAIATNNAFAVPILGGYAQFPGEYGALAPSTAPEGSTFTESFAPASFAVPTTLTSNGISATINHLGGLTYILPLPTNATYVPQSALAVGGDAATHGKATVTFCTSTAGATCTATAPGSSFPTDTTLPYLELFFDVKIPGGSRVTLPTLVVQLTASGKAGATIQPQVTEADVDANVTADGFTEDKKLAMYPVDPSFTQGSSAPPYYAYPLSTTTISPATGADAGTDEDAGAEADAGQPDAGGGAGPGSDGGATAGTPSASDAGSPPGEGSPTGSAATPASSGNGATGCGCTSGGVDPLALGFLLALAKVLRRRRGAACPPGHGSAAAEGTPAARRLSDALRRPGA